MTSPLDPGRATRLRKLLDLAADDRAPDGERQNAAARAADLLTRAGITEAQFRAANGQPPPPVEVYPYAVPTAGGHATARASLVWLVADALGCRALLDYATARGRERTLIVGISSDIATLRTLLPLILTQAERAATTRMRQRQLAPSDVGVFLQGFGNGVATRIAARRTALTGEQGTGAALVLADWSQRVNARFDELFPDTSPTERLKGSLQARLSGMDAGAVADLGDGLTTQQHQAIPRFRPPGTDS